MSKLPVSFFLFAALTWTSFSGFSQDPYRHYFEGETSRRLFKCRMEIADQELSGVLLVKKMGDDVFRMVFTTETGFKIFDMSVISESYTLHSALGPLEKKMIQTRLALTLQAAVLRPLDCGKVLSENEVSSWNCGKLKYRFVLERGSNRPTEVTIKRGGKVKAVARFGLKGDDSGPPDTVHVEHKGFPLKADFRLMNP